jgi:hypothetical protein
LAADGARCPLTKPAVAAAEQQAHRAPLLIRLTAGLESLNYSWNEMKRFFVACMLTGVAAVLSDSTAACYRRMDIVLANCSNATNLDLRTYNNVTKQWILHPNLNCCCNKGAKSVPGPEPYPSGTSGPSHPWIPKQLITHYRHASAGALPTLCALEFSRASMNQRRRRISAVVLPRSARRKFVT